MTGCPEAEHSEANDDTAFDGAAYRRGARDALPFLAPAIPFGVVLGLTVANSPVLSPWAGWSSSWMIFAGSSQIAAVRLFDQFAAGALIVLTVFMINARHIMYSAALRQRYANAPMWFRIVGSYLLIDQVFALDEQLDPDVSLGERIWRYLGAGSIFLAVWLIATAAGILVGAGIPQSWSLDFTVPLLFGSLLILGIRDRPGVVAAATGAIVVIVTRSWPSGTGLVVAILSGVAAGGVAESLQHHDAAVTP